MTFDDCFFFSSYFCSKHRLWLLVRTDSLLQIIVKNASVINPVYRVSTIYVMSKYKKHNVYPVKTKNGILWGSKLHGHVSMIFSCDVDFFSTCLAINLMCGC